LGDNIWATFYEQTWACSHYSSSYEFVCLVTRIIRLMSAHMGSGLGQLGALLHSWNGAD
jgi:hypothetical protein